MGIDILLGYLGWNEWLNKFERSVGFEEKVTIVEIRKVVRFWMQFILFFELEPQTA